MIFLMHLAHVCTPHLAQGVSVRISLHPHVIHDVMCLSVRWLFLVLSPFSLSPTSTFSLSMSTRSLSGPPSSMSIPPRVKTTALTHNEEYCLVAMYNPLTGYEPKLLDNFDYSETSAMIFQDESGDIDTEPSCSCDVELDDELIGKALSSPLFIQEREEPANLRQTYHSHEESLLPAQSFFHPYKYCETRVRTKFRFGLKNGNQVATWKTSESGFSLKDKKSKFSLISEPGFRNMNFKPILTGEVFRN